MGAEEWWYEVPAENDDQLSRVLYTYFESMKRLADGRLRTILENLRTYGAPATSPYIGAGAGYSRAQPNNPYANTSRVTVSLVQMCVDTLTSKLSKQQPRPQFITHGGNHASQRISERLQDFTDGMFYATRAYAKALQAFKDAAICGNGYLMPYADDDGGIGLERVFPYEIFVDDADGIYGEPENLYRVKYIDRGRLRALYPEFAEEIAAAQGMRQEDNASNARNNQVQVVEAWHRRSGTRSHDGRHVIAISNAVLLDEEWDEDEFDLIVIRYNPLPLGFYAQSLAEPVAPLQNELNTNLRKIQICMHFLAVPHWLKPGGSQIQFGAFNNQIGSVINYSGIPPELKIWQSVPAEYFQQNDWLYNKGFETSGISQLSAQSKIPGYGQMSGAALREYSDVESDRFQALGRAWEDFHLDLARGFIRVATRLAKDGDYQVTVVKKTGTGRPKSLEIIKWSEIAQDETLKYEVMIEPVSKFATDIPGALQTGQELVQAGLMDADTFKDLMRFPDLKREQDLDGAARDLVHKIVYNILEHGEKRYQDPDPYMDLAYAVKYATLQMNHAMADDYAKDRIELLRTWISSCDTVMQQAQQAAGQASAGPPGMPPTPAPPPQPLAPAPGAPMPPMVQ